MISAKEHPDIYYNQAAALQGLQITYDGSCDVVAIIVDEGKPGDLEKGLFSAWNCACVNPDNPLAKEKAITVDLKTPPSYCGFSITPTAKTPDVIMQNSVLNILMYGVELSLLTFEPGFSGQAGTLPIRNWLIWLEVGDGPLDGEDTHHLSLVWCKMFQNKKTHINIDRTHPLLKVRAIVQEDGRRLAAAIEPAGSVTARFRPVFFLCGIIG